MQFTFDDDVARHAVQHADPADFHFDDLNGPYPVVDLSKLGLEMDDDDDDDDEQRAFRRQQQQQQFQQANPLFSQNLLAALQRNNAGAGGSSPPLSSPFQSLGTIGSGSGTASGCETDVMRLFAAAAAVAQGGPNQQRSQDPNRASATTKALQALQARSRHPQPAEFAANDAASRGSTVQYDPALYGSLPPDIGSLECTVYVQYLPVTMKEIEFMDLICAHGAPKRVRICGNPKKEHNWTYGFVEYGTPEEAARFIKESDGTRAGPFRMRCNIAKTPIVDRLAIDAPPDGKCTFAQKFPNRTLRELILASIAAGPDEGAVTPGTQAAAQQAQNVRMQTGGAGGFTVQAGGPPLITPTSDTAPPVMPMQAVGGALGVPNDVASILGTAVKDAVRFVTDRTQSHFFAAKAVVQNAMEQAKRKLDTTPAFLATASLLSGTDVVFVCRLLLTAVHVLHGSFDDALRYALSALQSVPTPLAIVSYLNIVDSKNAERGLPRGLMPLMLNHLVCFGLLVESVSVVAARAFFHLAQHRAAMHGYPANKSLDAVLSSDVVPVPRGGSSLQRALFPLIATQTGGFPGYFLASLANNFTLEHSCVGVFAAANDTASVSDPATVAVGGNAGGPARSAW